MHTKFLHSRKERCAINAKPRGSSISTTDATLLINGGTRSGKEILAYGFKKYGFGPVVGTPTKLTPTREVSASGP